MVFGVGGWYRNIVEEEDVVGWGEKCGIYDEWDSCLGGEV